MQLKILSINFGHDGAASIVIDGKLTAHIQSERITRFKKQRGVNKKVIKYVLDKSGIKFDDIDVVCAVNWFFDRDANGNELFDKDEDGFRITKENGVYYDLNDYSEFYRNNNMAVQGFFNFHVDDKVKPCLIIDHHFAHCAYAYFTSPFDEAYSFSLDVNDNMGNNHSLCYFNNNSFRLIRKGGDFAVGAFYSQICDFLGFYPSLTDAGKVMALAAFENPSDNLKKISWPDVNNNNDIYRGDIYQHILSRHGIKEFPKYRNFYPQLKGEGGTVDPFWLSKKDWNKSPNKNIASDMQKILEISVFNFLYELFDDNKVSSNICFSGGTFLNCVMNGIIRKELHKMGINVSLSPACGDDGLTIGSSLFLSTVFTKNKRGEIIQKESEKRLKMSKIENIEGGKKYNKKEIVQSIKEKKLKYEELDDDTLCETVANYLNEDKIIGWFEGGSEIGPRALGKRSILANASNPKMKDILNEKVKHRENFRPFAPMVLAEHVESCFESGKLSDYMLFSEKCLIPDVVPSAVHIDDTARYQTIDKNNGRVYKLLKKYYDIKEIPIIINTSFNDAGEPIVETPEDAIECFMNTNIDILVLENFIIQK